jgi:hypothetical protein
MAHKQQFMVRLSERQLEFLENKAKELARQDAKSKEDHEPTLRASGETNLSATARRGLYLAWPELEKLA